LREAGSRDALESQPGTILDYWVEEEQLFIKQTFAQIGMPSCGDDVGIYEVQLLVSGNLRFIVIEDDCLRRRELLFGRTDAGNVRYERVP
jgi:hypothetical protein